MNKLLKNYNKNYVDQIARMFFTSTFAKTKINILLLMILTVCVRFILISVVCMLITVNLWVDFFLHSFLTILIILNSSIIQDVIMTKKAFFYNITRYLINNYTEQNFRIWKRNITLILSSIAISILLVVELSSYIMIYYIVQNLFIYFIIDQIETRKIHKLIDKIKEKPRISKFKNINLKENNFQT